MEYGCSECSEFPIGNTTTDRKCVNLKKVLCPRCTGMYKDEDKIKELEARIEKLEEVLGNIEVWSDYALWKDATDKDRKAMLENINREAEAILLKKTIESE